MAMYVLYELASGYGLFEAHGIDEIGQNTEAVRNSVTDLNRFGKVVKLHAFNPFESALGALNQCNAVSEGTIKINSDGSTFGVYGWAAYGGLARDGYGRWIEGFCGRIGYATPLQAELWGIRRAMKLASEKGWLEAIIEIGSLTAVKLINNNEDVGNHPDKTLIQDCRSLKDATLLELVHVLREGNKCADYMSKLGRVQGEQAMRVMVPPNELVQLLKVDMQGIAYMRGD